MILKRLIFVALFVLLNSINLNAQEQRYPKNALYFSYGSIIFESQVSIAYERLVFERHTSKTKLKTFLGKRLSNNFDYDEGARLYQDYFGLCGVQLIGSLEFNAGLAYSTFKLAPGFNPPSPTINPEEVHNDFVIYGSFGLRYEQNNFLMRVGINNLELLYVGLGVTF